MTLRALELLRRINEARRIGQRYAADLLDEELLDIDLEGGYHRRYLEQYLPDDELDDAAAKPAGGG